MQFSAPQIIHINYLASKQINHTFADLFKTGGRVPPQN